MVTFHVFTFHEKIPLPAQTNPATLVPTRSSEVFSPLRVHVGRGKRLTRMKSRQVHEAEKTTCRSHEVRRPETIGKGLVLLGAQEQLRKEIAIRGVFLRRVERVRELGTLAQAEVAELVSLQEHDAKFPLEDPGREALLDAVRTYVRVETLPDAEERARALRRVTARLLGSGNARLASSALSDLVLAAGVPLLTEEIMERIEGILRNRPELPTQW